MRANGIRLRRGLWCALSVAAASAAFGVAPAGAAITQTHITSPTSPFRYQFNYNASPAPTVTITGTTNSTAPGTDTVDLNCYYSRGGSLSYRQIASGVALQPNGSFSWTGPVDVDGYTCQLRAVPHGYNYGYPLSPFTGVYSELDQLRLYPVTGPSAPATPPYYDFFYTASSSAAYDDYNSVGSCGLDFSYPISPTQDNAQNSTWDCAGALYRNDGSGTRTEILIDGKNAYDSYEAYKAYSDSTASPHTTSGQNAGFPGVLSSYSKDASTGNVTIHEGEDLVSCADASYPATETKCGGTVGSQSTGTWLSDGVSFARSISQTSGGQVVSMTDTYKSTDGHAHSLDLAYDNYIGYPNGSGNTGDPVFALPGTSGYLAYAPGDTSTLSGRSTDAIYVKDGDYPDPNPYDGPGALIYNTQPNYISFTSAYNNTANDFVLDYQRTVPAGGSISITHTYITGADTATVQTLANRTLDQTYKPAVSITSPANGTVSHTSSLQVSGTASAHDGLTLRVNGEAVNVNPNGTWSTALALHQGSNVITAVASDGSGNNAQTAETVVYSQQQFCIVPNVTNKSLGKAKRALKKAGCAVGRIAKVRSHRFRKGRVEHASSATGTVLAKGTKVGLTESVGKHGPKSHKKHARRHSRRH